MAMSIAQPGYTFTSLPPAISPLQTRSQVSAAALSLVYPLLPHFSQPHRSLVRLPLSSTGTRHDFISAYFEAYARPLWALGPLLAGSVGSKTDGGSSEVPPEMVHYWLDGLRSGTDPRSPGFWGYAQDRDQRMVEMCPLGFALCVIPRDIFWDKLSAQEQANVGKWLGVVNQKQMPDTNWLWFRVFANLALKVNKLEEYDEDRLEKDLDRLDEFYAGHGWSNDGPPDSGCLQMDYYSGSFAIQLAQLIYVKMCRGEINEKVQRRVKEYEERAREFAKGFLRWWDPQGRGITFGRSLTYRFAMAGFWSALAYSEIDNLPKPLTLGVIKGLLLRSLRWWTERTDMETNDGTLTIGYTYPNQFMSENYNSVGSTYWFMLGFLALALPERSEFWTCNEEPYPLSDNNEPQIMPVREPLHILVQSGGHTFFLSSGQMCHYPVRASESKYGKFAYSSAFGYSVPTGKYDLQSIGGDNALVLSDDDGETWKVKRVPLEARIEDRYGLPILTSAWQPWADVRATTWLIPPSKGYDNWHLRLHRIESGRRLKTSDAAFAIKGLREHDGRELTEVNHVILGRNMEGLTISEGRYQLPGEALAASSAGVVGIADLPISKEGVSNSKRQGVVLDEDANSNLVESRTALPTLAVEIGQGSTICFATAIFAMPSSVGGWKMKWQNKWEKRPELPRWAQGILLTPHKGS